MIVVNQDRTRIWMFLFLVTLAWAILPTPVRAAGGLVAEPEIIQTFDDFQHKWMTLLTDRGMYGTGYLKVEENPYRKGSYRASYKELGQILGSRVKKTGHNGTPYVGVMKYYEVIFVSTGETPEAAKQGPFAKESERTVTEIFRYAKGKWLY